MQILSMRNDRHLGDSISVMTLVHSRALETGERFLLRGPDYLKDLLELFDFCGLIYDGPCPEGDVMLQPIINLMPKFEEGPLRDNRSKVRFLNAGMYQTINWDYRHPNSIHLPAMKFASDKQNLVCFQFDSRSLHYGKPEISDKEARGFLRRFSFQYEKVMGIGGPDTEKYLPEFDFFLGELKQLARCMASSGLFVGIDSGMSHLAGLCRTKGEILITHVREMDYVDLVEFYNRMYPSLRTHLRNKQVPML